MKTSVWRIASYVTGAVSVAVAVFPAALGPADVPVPQHHIGHAVLIVGGVITGLLAAIVVAPRTGPPKAAWIAPTVIAPMVAMYFMWPSALDYLDLHPLLHGIEHLSYVFFGFITAYAGQRYVRGVGWITGTLLACMAFAAAGFFGVAPPMPALATVRAVPGQATPSTIAARETASTNKNRSFDYAKLGAQVYMQSCASCHGATGKGTPGAFPALVNDAVVNGTDGNVHVNVVLHGLANKAINSAHFATHMPAFATQLTDAQVAAVVDYERTSWGNHGHTVTPQQVEHDR